MPLQGEGAAAEYALFIAGVAFYILRFGIIQHHPVVWFLN